MKEALFSHAHLVIGAVAISVLSWEELLLIYPEVFFRLQEVLVPENYQVEVNLPRDSYVVSEV